MANIKITELNEKTEVGLNDVIPIVDNISNETKKITGANLLKNQYSTNEIKTNMKWIDNKPIYRKVITTNSLTPEGSATGKTIAHGISNLDKIVELKCIANTGDDVYFDFNNFTGTTENNEFRNTVNVFIDDTNIYVNNSGVINFVNYAHFILEYTKTTD